ncbi:MAG: hypothetical protein NTX61_03290 [Bacteroidetes bacterium]|nr:hypothetical protein [Bacteroidota bacterium]
MKKAIPIFVFLMVGFTRISFAGTGNARDGYLFVAFLIGLLTAVCGILFFIDFLHKNGKQILVRLIAKWHSFQYRHEHPSRNSSQERFEITIT